MGKSEAMWKQTADSWSNGYASLPVSNLDKSELQDLWKRKRLSQPHKDCNLFPSHIWANILLSAEFACEPQTWVPLLQLQDQTCEQ